MTRAERIAKAKALVHELKPAYERLKRQWEKAQQELREAENGIEPGDRVRVKILCNRGCCVEEDYEGTVIMLDKTINSPNKFWIVSSARDNRDRSVVEHDMERIT